MSRPRRRLLLDECVDRRLAIYLDPHEVSTVAKVGWSGVTNGQLLCRAEQDFEILITVDRNLSFQQSVIDFKLAIIVLHAISNRLDALLPLVPKLLKAITSAKPGQVIQVF